MIATFAVPSAPTVMIAAPTTLLNIKPYAEAEMTALVLRDKPSTSFFIGYLQRS
jgi:hypothetical protein